MNCCSVGECDRPVLVQARQLCRKHYRRWQRLGDPEAPISRNEPGSIPRLIEQLLAEAGAGGCRFVPGHNGDGYPMTSVAGRTQTVATLVCGAAHGERPDGFEVLHSCDDKGCIAPWHLRWGTSSQNRQEAWDRGRRVRA